MTGFNFPTFQRREPAGAGGAPPTGRPPRIPLPGPGRAQSLVTLLLAAAIVYGGYFWFIRRVVVAPSEVLILLKKWFTDDSEHRQFRSRKDKLHKGGICRALVLPSRGSLP